MKWICIWILISFDALNFISHLFDARNYLREIISLLFICMLFNLLIVFVCSRADGPGLFYSPLSLQACCSDSQFFLTQIRGVYQCWGSVIKCNYACGTLNIMENMHHSHYPGHYSFCLIVITHSLSFFYKMVLQKPLSGFIFKWPFLTGMTEQMKIPIIKIHWLVVRPFYRYDGFLYTNIGKSMTFITDR